MYTTVIERRVVAFLVQNGGLAGDFTRAGGSGRQEPKQARSERWGRRQI
jgi:hypothetical protein